MTFVSVSLQTLNSHMYIYSNIYVENGVFMTLD